jgi:hypothetical protein
MKTYEEVDLLLYTFLTCALGAGEWSASWHDRFILGENVAGIHWIGGWLGPSAGVDAVVKRKNPFIAPPGYWSPVVQPVAQSWYWLRYRDYIVINFWKKIIHKLKYKF